MSIQNCYFLCLLLSIFFLRNTDACNEQDELLFNLYREASKQLNAKRRKEIIEVIKIAHESNNIGYDITLKSKDHFSMLYGITPLAFACCKDPEFANYLLHEKEVSVCEYALPYLGLGVANDGFSQEHEKLFTSLLDKKAHINGGILKRGEFTVEEGFKMTPLNYYLAHLDYDRGYNPSFINKLLYSGADLRKGTYMINRWNAISLAIDPSGSDEEVDPSIATSLVAHLLNERLYEVKKDWFNFALVCKYIKAYKIFMPYVGNVLFRSSDACDDVHRALTKSDYIIQDHQTDTFSFVSAEEKIKKATKRGALLAEYTDLHEIISLKFWQEKSFPDIVKSLIQVIQKYPMINNKKSLL